MIEERRGPGADSIAFASLLSGAYASATVALFFLAVDTVRGEPLLTPSLMGSVVILGETPSADLPLRLDMMAYYSLVHYVVFTLLGTAATLTYARLPGFLGRPYALAAGILAALLAGELLITAVWLPGLVATIGTWAVGFANLAAALVMAGFIHRTLTGGAPSVAADPAAAAGRALR